MKALLLDDNPMNNLILERFLQPMGVDCVCLNSGVDALSLIEAEAKAGRSFDLLFCDIIMGGDLDGYEVITRLRKMEKQRPAPGPRSPAGPPPLVVVALTAMRSAKSEEKAKEMGADLFMSKPVTRLMLADVVKRLELLIAGREDQK